MAMRKRTNGEDAQVPRIPLAYKILLYRRKMNLSYQEVTSMPLDVFNNDWEMMDLEATGRIRLE